MKEVFERTIGTFCSDLIVALIQSNANALLFWMLVSISLVRFSHMTFRAFIKDYFDFGRQRDRDGVGLGIPTEGLQVILVAYSIPFAVLLLY